MQSRSMLAALLVSMSVLLSGCDSADNTRSAAREQPAASADQAEVEKYNAYVDAANYAVGYSADFADILDKRKEQNPALFDAHQQMIRYYAVSESTVAGLQKKLQTALTLPYAMPELDEPATGMVAAMTTLQPMLTELSSYADSKGYLVDEGKKARDMEPALDDALRKIAEHQAQFEDGIRKRDDMNVRAEFDKAQKGTEAYYRAGIVIYAKESAQLSGPFFASAGSEETSKPFGESLTKTAEMIEGWSKSGASGKTPQNCTILLSDFNTYVGRGREAIVSARSGRYKRGGQSEIIWAAINPLKKDEQYFNMAFGKVINGLNNERCN